MVRFCELHDDILLAIMRELPVPSLLRVSATCKVLSRLIKDSGRLQYSIDLFAAGYVSRPCQRTSALHQSTLMAAHVRRWDTMSWQRKASTVLPRSTKSSWISEYRKGLYVEVDTEHLAIARVGSGREGICVTSIKLPVYAVDVKKIVVDPEQDLLVLVNAVDESKRLTAFFFTLNGLPHPEAHSYIRCGENHRGTGEVLYDSSPLACDVWGDYMGVVTVNLEQTSQMTIWNWKTCKRLCSLTIPRKTYSSLCFLSPTSFIASDCSTNPMTLEHFHFSPSPPCLTLTKILEFPLLRQSRPFRYSVRYSHPTNSLSTLPFEPHTGYIAVSVDLSLSGFFLVVVDPSILTDPSAFPSTSPSPAPIEWARWGEAYTRWFSHDGNIYAALQGPSFLFGSRAVIQRYTQPSEYTYRIADFNMLRVRRHRDDFGKDAQAHVRLVTEASVICHPALPDGEIECRLPFLEVEIRSPFEQRPHWSFLDDERIVGVRVDGVGNSHTTSMDVLYMT